MWNACAQAGTLKTSWLLILGGSLFFIPAAVAQTTCQPPKAKPPSADPSSVEDVYKAGKYDAAESLYLQQLQQKPGDPDLTAALVHTLLHENRLEDALGRSQQALADTPHSAPLLTALAEVQLRQGKPWLAAQTLDAAAAADPCYARSHFIRSRIYRIDSMYASERAELETAYQLDPSDADIWHQWLRVIRPANEIEGIDEALRATPDLDADSRQKALTSATEMVSLLTENSQTCEDAPLVGPTTIPLRASYAAVKDITSYKLRVDLAATPAQLIVDTAASGFFISRKIADSNGLQHQDGDPPGTVRSKSIHVGALEFRNCMVGISDTPFADNGDGYIGTDVFARYLLTLNFPQSRIDLLPLPSPPHATTVTAADASLVDLPGDRSPAIEGSGFTPVYHRKQFLMVPVTLNKKERSLFVLGTGMRLTTMTSDVAHSISTTRVNFTNTVKTVSGGSLQMYRDAFDLQFGPLSMDRQGQVIAFDPTAMDENTGISIAGLLGFNLLHNLIMQIDYRDGLIKFESPASGPARMNTASATTPLPSPNVADEAASCRSYANQNVDQPLNSTLEGGIVGGLDSSRLKDGQAITLRVIRDWISPVCTLTPNAILYGHVLTATSAQHGAPSQLAVVFDHGNCSGHPRQELALRVIGVAGGDSRYEALHNAIPTEVRGGGRNISSTVASMGAQQDDKLNGSAGPETVHLGMVSGLPRLKLTPEGGLQCSVLLTSTERTVHLGTDTEFIMTMQSPAP